MYRYYVSFAHQSPTSFGVATLDIAAAQRITSADDLTPITADLTARGYRNVQILAFSLYANPTQPPAGPRPEPQPRRAERGRHDRR